MSEGINRPINELTSCRGKTVNGATLGILMLETKFSRIHGDVGNAMSFDFPVIDKVVPGATSYRVVQERGEGLDDAAGLERAGNGIGYAQLGEGG